MAVTRAQITNLQKQTVTEIQKFFSEQLTLYKALKTNRLAEHIRWDDNLQLEIPAQFRLKGAPQGMGYSDTNIPLKHADAAMATAKHIYNVAGIINSLRYDKLIEMLNDVQALKLIGRLTASQWDTFMHQCNIAQHVGVNGRVCAKVTNSDGGSVLTVPAGEDYTLLYEGLAVEFNDSGQPGFSFTDGTFNAGYYGVISDITENNDGTVSVTCVRTDGSTPAAFTAAHSEQPLYMVSCYARLPQGFADFRAVGNTIGGAVRAGRYNPVVIDASGDTFFQNNPFRAIHEMRLRINRKGRFKVDTLYTDSYTFAWLCDKLSASIQRDNTVEMVGFSTNVRLISSKKENDLYLVDDPDAPLGNIDLFPSKNVWIATLGKDEPGYVDDGEYHAQRVPGYLVNEIAIWWLLQVGLYDLGQWGCFKNCHKLFMGK